MRALILIPALLLSTAVAARVESGEAQLAKILAGRTAGKPQSCLPLFDRNDSQTLDGVGIAFRSGRTTWIGRFDDGCHVGPNDTIVTTTSMSQLCRGDIIHVVDQMSHMEHDTCGFRDFTPYTKAK